MISSLNMNERGTKRRVLFPRHSSYASKKTGSLSSMPDPETIDDHLAPNADRPAV